MGIEKPILFEPEAVATFIPTTFPLRSRSGPPELPGLIAASVCITFFKVSIAQLDCWASIVRPKPDMTPTETELLN